MKVWAGAALGVIAFAAAGAAAAQAPADSAPVDLNAAPAAEAGLTTFPASFFAQFRPTSARDMVQNVPGFSFDRGDDVRGFGGAAGNVLIDGQRPTSKTVNIDNVLQRIPSENVVRIELIRGGAPGIDMQGQPVIVNVVRKSGASETRTAQLTVKPWPQFGFYGLSPRLEESWRSGALSFDGLIGGRRDKSSDSGEGILERRRANGAIFESGKFEADVDVRSLNSNAAIEYRGDGATYHLNGSVDRSDQDRQEAASMTDAAGRAFTERSRTKTRADKAEVGADYERLLNDVLTFRLLGLKTFKADKSNGLSVNRNPTQQSRETSTSGETILRSTVTAVPSERLQIEAGGEGAFNYLDAHSSLIVGGAPVALPSANVRVEEKRAEGFATVTSKFGALSVESGLRYETSTISQSGGANQKKTLSFLKPRLFATYTAGSRTLRLRVERTVGQLNFRDFAASAEVDAGTVNAGNPNLEPERAWAFEGAVEQRFWGSGAIVLTVRHEEVQSVVDLIPVAGRFDAPGNIGDGTRGEAKLGVTLPLQRLGIGGAVFRANAAWRWSQVTDPVTGRERRISQQRPFEGDFEFSKSVPSLSSTFLIQASASGGGSGSGFYRETSYRISEIRRNKDDAVIKLIWDWTPRPGTVMRFQVENALGKDRVRDRTLFSGPRSNGVVNVFEHRAARLDPLFFVRIRQRL